MLCTEAGLQLPSTLDLSAAPPSPCLLNRRTFLSHSALLAGGCAACFSGFRLWGATPQPLAPGVISPGCRKSKVRVAKLYLGRPQAHWPTPELDLKAEHARYQAEFARMKDEFADVDFVVDELITDKPQLARVQENLKPLDGNLIPDLKRFCRFAGITMINEA